MVAGPKHRCQRPNLHDLLSVWGPRLAKSVFGKKSQSKKIGLSGLATYRDLHLGKLVAWGGQFQSDCRDVSHSIRFLRSSMKFPQRSEDSFRGAKREGPPFFASLSALRQNRAIAPQKLKSRRWCSSRALILPKHQRVNLTEWLERRLPVAKHRPIRP